VNVLVEGPHWMGEWSEIVCAALQNLGHTTRLHYHNVKPLAYRLHRCLGPLQRLVGNTPADLPAWSNRQLLQMAAAGPLDVLISIQGKIDAATLRQLRIMHPRLRVVFWFGDVLFDRALPRITAVYDDVDQVLISYRGDCERLQRDLGPKVTYFPFGVSSAFHRLGPLSPVEKKRYSVDVAFVGTRYPERDQILTAIAASPDLDLAIWGRSWRKSRQLHSRGRLSMPDSLKVHHLAKISLNIHHHLTNNGFNMKFYEIPSVGGFQICEWQPELAAMGLEDKVATFRQPGELPDLLRYYLTHDEERRRLAERCAAHVWEHCTYEQRFANLVGL